MQGTVVLGFTKSLYSVMNGEWEDSTAMASSRGSTAASTCVTITSNVQDTNITNNKISTHITLV